MPEFIVTSPDGRKFKVKAKDGATQAQAQAYADKHFADFPAPPKAPSGLGAAFADIPREMGHQFMEATRAQQQTIRDAEAKQQRLARGERHPGDFLPDLTVPKMLMNAMGQLSAPASGAVISALGRPVETATGGRLNREDVGNAAMMGVPFADELALSREASGLARTLGVSEKTAREVLAGRKQAAARQQAMAKRTPHQEDSDSLLSMGVEMNPWQAAGGVKRRMLAGMKANPLVGEAIREDEADSRHSWNRSIYNHVVEPLGHVFDDKNMPLRDIGRKGIAAVEKMISDVYERVKPGLRFRVDDAFRAEDIELRKRISLLPAPQKAFVEKLFEARVDPALKKGALDGQQFKDVESFLGTEARTARSSSNPYDHQVSEILRDAQALMRENAERHSDPSVVNDLKAANESWARFVRVRDASVNRTKSRGIFTPGDLLAAIKRDDSSPGKGAFARGDAILTKHADAAENVLTDRMAHGGAEQLQWATPGILGAGVGGMLGHIPGALIGTALGYGIPPLTNPVARAALKSFPAVTTDAAATMRASRPSALSAIAPAAGVAGESRKRSGITAEIEGKPETAVNLTPDLRVAGPTVYDDDGKAVSLKGSAPAATPSPAPVQPAAPAATPAAPKSGGVTVYDDSGKAITLQ